jgi:hypothetical protein
VKSGSSVALIATCALACLLACPAAVGQTDKTFPTDDEIKLVIAQAKRALSDYVVSVRLEEKLAGKTDDVDNDHRVIDGLTAMSSGIETHPQSFNSPAGFEFILLLDDASRNAALCNGGAIQKGVKAIADGENSTKEEYLQLAQSCTSASNLLYMVSENAAALYQRYANGEQDLAQQAFDSMNKCLSILKQQKPK